MTVLVAVYNGGTTLAGSIESILEQSFTDLELLVVDDGSTDGTSAYLSSISDGRLRVLRVPNGGVGAALQIGLESARGTYIARQDADDVAHPDRLALQVEILDTDPNIALVGSWALAHNGDGKVLCVIGYPTSAPALAWLFLFDNAIVCSTAMFRRHEALAAGGYTADSAEDYDLWSRLGRIGAVINVGRTLVAYQLAPSGVHAVDEAQIAARARLISADNIATVLAETPGIALADDVAGLHRLDDRPSADELLAAIEVLFGLRQRFAARHQLQERDSAFIDRHMWRIITAASVLEARPANVALLVRLARLCRREGWGASRVALLGGLVAPAFVLGGGRCSLVRRLARRLLQQGMAPPQTDLTGLADRSSAFARTLDAMRVRSTQPTVAFVIDNAAGGGAELMVLELASAFARRGHRVILCHTRVAPTLERRKHLEADGVALICLERTSRWRLDQWWPLIRALRRERVDVLSSHLPGSNAWCSLLRVVRPGMRFIATEHGGAESDRRSEMVNRFVGHACDSIVAVSAATAEWLVDSCGVPARKVAMIPNGSSLPVVDPGERRVRELRAEWGDEGDLFVGAVAMLRPQKRVDLIIDAFALIARDVPNAHLVVVGDGPERTKLQEQAAARGVPRVHFLGYREDVEVLLAAFDVFVTASELEGAPRALIEAMAAGLGIVATSVGGIPALAPDGECAVLVPPRDVDSLAAGVVRLLKDSHLRALLGGTAHVRAQERFGFETMVDAWSSLW